MPRSDWSVAPISIGILCSSSSICCSSVSRHCSSSTSSGACGALIAPIVSAITCPNKPLLSASGCVVGIDAPTPKGNIPSCKVGVSLGASASGDHKLCSVVVKLRRTFSGASSITPSAVVGCFNIKLFNGGRRLSFLLNIPLETDSARNSSMFVSP